MNNAESEAKPKLYPEICEILRLEWDPIGVGGSAGALHEYDGYAQSLLEMILRGATENEIFAYLWWAETENMELEGDRPKAELIAARLNNLRL